MSSLTEMVYQLSKLVEAQVGVSSEASSDTSSESGDEGHTPSCRVCGGPHDDTACPSLSMNGGQYVNQVLIAEEQLRADKRFPRTTREIAAKLLKTCRKGKFGLFFPNHGGARTEHRRYNAQWARDVAFDLQALSTGA